jgi:hypothetical protein
VFDLSKDKILAQATVELIEEHVHGPSSPISAWEVTVFGGPKGGRQDYRRIYTIEAKTDNNAAQEGIRLFVEEMENLRDAKVKDD